MSLSGSYYAVVSVDLFLNALLVFVFSQLKLRKTWKWLHLYLIVRLCYGLLLQSVISVQSLLSHTAFERTYFVAFYVGFICLLVVNYFLYIDVFRRAMVPFPGFEKHVNKLVYVAIAGAAILMFSSIGSANAGDDRLARIGVTFVHATGTIGLCVAAFLTFVVYSMGLPLRSKVFGIILGFFICDSGDIAETIAFQLHISLRSPVFSYIEFTSVLTAAIWIAYAYIPEPAPRPVTLPADSPVYRWSQIAMALGNKGAQVALPEPQHSFFLTDVEKVVDRVFARNMVGKESER